MSAGSDIVCITLAGRPAAKMPRVPPTGCVPG